MTTTDDRATRSPAPSRTPDASRVEKLSRAVLPPLGLGLALVGFWYYVSYIVLEERRRFLLRPIHQVIKVGFLDADNLTEELQALWSSPRIALIGLSIAICIGFTLAITMSQTKIFEKAIFPYMVTLQAIPILAVVPLISFWFGTGPTSRIVVCVMISLFPIIVNTLFGLQSVSPQMRDLFKITHSSRWTTLRRLEFPAALPAIFTGLRISAGMAVVGAIVADFFFRRGQSGIGLAIDTYRNLLDGEMLYGAIILASLLGLAAFWLFGLLSRLVVGKWYQPDRR